MIVPQKILISRVDAIGDVTLTLPMCGYLKSIYQNCEIVFLGRDYTRPVVNFCKAVNEFISLDFLRTLSQEEQILYLKKFDFDTVIHVYPQRYLSEITKKAGIKHRIGTTNRLYHWFNCNNLVRLSRKNSDLHEAQLNIKLLNPLGITDVPDTAHLPQYYQLKNKFVKEPEENRLFKVVIHPKSHGSGKEWGLENYQKLISLLSETKKYDIFITGSVPEQEILKDWIKKLPTTVTDLTGKLNLTDFINFLAKADGLIASGTGPLHLAAALGINTLGLFPTTKPIHAERWGPVGEKADFIESKNNNDYFLDIYPEEVFNKIIEWLK